MIPEHQTWSKAEDIVYLEKNHGSGDSGYYVNVQGTQEILNSIKKKLNSFEVVNCQWNSVALATGEKMLTVREVSQNFQGAQILKLVGNELVNLGYSRCS